MISDDGHWQTEWMFRLLDYEHYRVFHRGVELGLVVINHADRSLHYAWFDDVDLNSVQGVPTSYRRARPRIRSHERPF